jgi:glycerophosphoryl diester phosphodiesterase
MKQIGNNGTPLMWATHENTTLRAILRQMDIYGYENELLKNWLLNITKDEGRDGRLIDMNAFTLQHYFHPYMKGKTSIKKTLPAIWNHHSFLHEIPWFKQYYKADAAGNILNPYQTLKYIFAAGSIETEMAEKEIEEVVKEGGAAMKAYNDMMYGPVANKEKLKQQLLEYCKLDTMAMVIIWTYWKYAANSSILQTDV